MLTILKLGGIPMKRTMYTFSEKLIVVLVSIFFAGCGFYCDCPDPGDSPLSSGEYSGKPIATNQAFFPHGMTDTTNFRMTLDKSANVVEFRYSKGGTEVVEKWRITKNLIEH